MTFRSNMSLKITRGPYSLGGLWPMLWYLLGALSAFAAEPVAPFPHRYLFVVDTSYSMAARSTILRELAFQLVRDGLDGRIQTGDAVELWTFTDEVRLRAILTRAWSPQLNQATALRMKQALENARFERQNRMDLVIREVDTAVRQGFPMTILLFSDGDQPLKGTPFDGPINALYKQLGRDVRQRNQVFVTAFAAHNGQLTGWQVSAGERPVRLPLPITSVTASATPSTGAPPVVTETPTPSPPKPAQQEAPALKTAASEPKGAQPPGAQPESANLKPAESPKAADTAPVPVPLVEKKKLPVATVETPPATPVPTGVVTPPAPAPSTSPIPAVTADTTAQSTPIPLSAPRASESPKPRETVPAEVVLPPKAVAKPAESSAPVNNHPVAPGASVTTTTPAATPVASVPKPTSAPAQTIRSNAPAKSNPAALALANDVPARSSRLLFGGVALLFGAVVLGFFYLRGQRPATRPSLISKSMDRDKRP